MPIFEQVSDRFRQSACIWIPFIKLNDPQTERKTKLTVPLPGGGSARAFQAFIPATGRHYIWYRGQPILVEREREAKTVDMCAGGVEGGMNRGV